MASLKARISPKMADHAPTTEKLADLSTAL
jgi:hypothetical protein